MFKNYLTVAVRNLLKHRLYSAINIFGLAIGIASCILIVLFVRDELSYDRFIPNAERIYRVETRFDIPGRSAIFGGVSPGPAWAIMQKDFPMIEAGVRFGRVRPTFKRGADVFREDLMLSDPSLFDVFDLPLVAGDKTKALSDSTGVMISQSMARKYFGDTPAVGQVIDATFSFSPADVTARPLHVTAVFKDIPDNSHFKMDFISRINESDYEKMPWMFKDWTSLNTWTYLKLRSPADAANIEKGFKAFEERNVPSFPFSGKDLKIADYMTLSLVKLEDIHLKSKGMGQFKAPGDAKSVATFAVVAVMILLIACINFTNLATARASQRAREVALRKVVGAKRPQLIAQFLSESVLTALVALTIAVGLVQLVLPAYNTVLQKQLALDFAGAGTLIAAMFGLIVLVGVVAGLYPAMVLSGFLPSRILKANKSAAAEGSGRLRTALVVIQFAISIGLLICTAVVYGQTLYAKTMNLGFDPRNLMVVRTPNQKSADDVLRTLREEVAKLPGVTAATISGATPPDTNNNNNIVEVPGRPSPTPILLEQKSVDYDFFTTFKVPLLAGRYFDEAHGGDDFPHETDAQVRTGANIIINEKALGVLGFSSPQEAVGQQIRAGAGRALENKTMMLTIVGVVGDVYFRSVRDEMQGMYFARDSRDFRSLVARFDGVTGPALRDATAKIWRDLAPSDPYTAQFIQQLEQDQYQAEDAQTKLFAAFAGLAIVIACLGLYGLAAFTAERRTKEIGIRKVLGAKVRDVVRLLVWDFSKPVLVANLLAWPAAYMLMRDWLNGYPYRIDLGPLPFILAGLGAIAIAWVTVASHAARAAQSNPIHALRYE
ncbi:MAG: ABC transporter permease [Rhodospirillaceae bacterium]